MERIRALANKTIGDIGANVGVLASAVSDLGALVERYRAELEPIRAAIPLPAYFGGVTLNNRSVDSSLDVCNILGLVRNDAGGEGGEEEEEEGGWPGPACSNPVEVYTALAGLYREARREVVSTRNVLARLTADVAEAVERLDVRESAAQLIGLVRGLSERLEGLVVQLGRFVEDDRRRRSGGGGGGDGDEVDISSLVSAEALLVGGLLDSDTYPKIGELWEVEFIESFRRRIGGFESIAVSPFASNSLKYEMVESVGRLRPILVVNILVMIVFCMSSCFERDLVASKPWVGLAGVLTTLVSTFSGFGFLVSLGSEFTNFNYAAVFILLGIG